MAIAHASAPDCRPELRVIELDDIDRRPDFRARWSDTVQRCGDIYYDLDYLRAAAAGEEGAVRLAHFDSGHGRVLYPFVERPIEGNRFDTVTPYAYGGPLLDPAGSGDGARLAGAFFSAFADLCAERRVVSEFVRFHPLLDPSGASAWKGELRSAGENVVLALDRDEDGIFAGYRPHLRREIRRARRAGLSIELGGATGPRMAAFEALYAHAMERLDAQRYLRFGQGYFRALGALPADKLLLATGRTDDGQVVCGGLMLLGARTVHYHLAARDERHKRIPAIAQMLHETALHARRLGKSLFHLGGAAPAQVGLREFKEGFSNQRVDYVVGCRVHDPAAYRLLTGASADSDFFPAYRTPIR